MHSTITFKLKSSEKKIFQYCFIPKIMILPFLSQTFTHDWQVHSVCCKSSGLMNRKKNLMIFNFTVFLSNLKKNTNKNVCVFKPFQYTLHIRAIVFVPCGGPKKSPRMFIKCSYYSNPQGLHLQSFFILHKRPNKAPTELTEPRHQPNLHDLSGRLSTFVLPLFFYLSSTRVP